MFNIYEKFRTNHTVTYRVARKYFLERIDTTPHRGTEETGRKPPTACARRTWSQKKAEPSGARCHHWVKASFDRPPATNNISVRLNLCSNVLLKQVILLKNVDTFMVTHKQCR